MINLFDRLGLPLLLNPRENILQPSGAIHFNSIDRVKLESLKPILLNKTIHYPVNVYDEYYDICTENKLIMFEKYKLHFNLILLPAGLLGIEYRKTHIFSPDKDQNEITCIAQVINGKGFVLMQKMKEKEEFETDSEINTVYYMKIKKGSIFTVPQKFMYNFINTGEQSLVITRLFEDDGKIDYRTIWREQGMCYYVIRKNARKEIVKNPRYKNVPAIVCLKKDGNVKKFNLSENTPLYNQFLKNPEKFKKLLV